MHTNDLRAWMDDPVKRENADIKRALTMFGKPPTMPAWVDGFLKRQIPLSEGEKRAMRGEKNGRGG